MARQRYLTVRDTRALTPTLHWITLESPELAREVRAGQYLLVRCDEPEGTARLLRRALFVAATEPALGQVALLLAPNEPGLIWLARARPGAEIDVIGPLGRPFQRDGRSRNLLLLGSGSGLAALLLLARENAAANGGTTLLAAGETLDDLPPAFLLPGDVEYETAVGTAEEMLAAAGVKAPGTPAKAALKPDTSPILWADQLFAALPASQVAPLRRMVRAERMRWEHGFASVLLEGPLVCGFGACGLCAVEVRRGTRLLCADGPVFDLRDLLGE
jgi:dihydroorotate dehydrogenase electron transfer subunit